MWIYQNQSHTKIMIRGLVDFNLSNTRKGEESGLQVLENF
jgi:hypothetical protein